MAETFFKNKNRRKAKAISDYTSEHERLGVEVLEYPVAENSIPQVGQNADQLFVNNKSISENESPLDEQEDKGQEFNFLNIKHGDLVLIYQDGVIDVGSEEKIKDTLTSVLMDSDEGQNVSVEDFVVMRRLKIRAGVFIDD